MNDFNERPIYIGDIVIALRYNGTSAELYQAKVMGFTKKFVCVKPLDKPHITEVKVSPEKVVKFN